MKINNKWFLFTLLFLITQAKPASAFFKFPQEPSFNRIHFPKPTKPPKPPCHNKKCNPTPSPIPTNTPIPTPTLTPTPTPAIIVFAQDRPASFTTDPFTIPTGYKSITFNVSSTDFIINWAAQVSMDGETTYKEQHRFRCSGNVCPVVTIPILNNSYKFGTGTSGGNITSVGTLNIEPGAQVSVLGNGVSLPFTSSTFDSTGFSSITVTVGQGNPQNLTGISLQRFESGSFIEKVHLICDGGAECPLQSMSLIGGTYRVVIEGTGTDALVGSIIRP